MAASMAGALGTFSQISRSHRLIGLVKIPILAVPVRYSRYGNKYLEPTFRKEDLTEPLEENDERRFKPIKAAVNEANCSFTYNPLLAKLTTTLMGKGRKDLARLIVDKTMERIKQQQLIKYHKETDEENKSLIELNPVILFEAALDNCRPLLKIQKVRRGTVDFQVPIPITDSYAQFKSIKFIIEAAQDMNRSRPSCDRLASVIVNAANNEGGAIRKKQELHRRCEANRAYAHYRY